MPNVSGRRAVVSKHHASTMSGKRKHALLLDMSQNFVVAPLGRVVFASLAREFVRKKTSATLSPARVHDIDATIGVLLARAFIVSSPLSSNHIRSPRLPAACQPTEPTPATPTPMSSIIRDISVRKASRVVAALVVATKRSSGNSLPPPSSSASKSNASANSVVLLVTVGWHSSSSMAYSSSDGVRTRRRRTSVRFRPTTIRCTHSTVCRCYHCCCHCFRSKSNFRRRRRSRGA
jgi:hypothetical protein